ncbi:flagella basal body P-ring formation protein FlgA [Pseudomonas sp. URMO17WK12:I1]|nr:flagella basal body P-ring formation protein FlgA [Pseudomonas sp. URMO17WK12:I1]
MDFSEKSGTRTTSPLPLFREAVAACGSLTSATTAVATALLAVALSYSNGAFADAEQQIDARIRTYLASQLDEHAEQQGWQNPQITYKRTALGTSRTLPNCASALQLERLDEGRGLLERQRLQVACPDDGGWQQVSLVTPSVLLPVLVATTVTDRGAPLAAEQFQLQAQDVARLPRGFYQDADEVAGQIAKRRIRTGQVLTPNLVAPALLVTRGQTVTMIARQGDIQASTAGTALEDGQIGQLIRVRNQASDTVIRARVKAKGVVTTQRQ